MRSILTIFKNFENDPKTKQILRLFSVTLVTIPIGIATSVFLTRYLGAEKYGDFNFLTSIFNFSIVLSTFGFMQAGNRTLVLNNNRETAKEYFGTLLVILGGIFLLMSFFLYIYGLFDENLKEKSLNRIFMLIIPAGSVFLLMKYFETLFQADNQIKLLSQSRLIPKVVFGIAALGLYFFFTNTNLDKLKLLWLVFFITQLGVYLYIVKKIGISFKNFKKRFGEIWVYNKSYGFNVYLGSLFAVGFSSLTQVLIGYFGNDNTGVGFYSLAIVLSMPLSFIPNTIATTHYKDFSQSKEIPKKLMIITLGLSLASLVAIWLIVPPFVSVFYGVEYTPVIKINVIVSIGVVFYGIADFFNRFLGANGQGAALRNSSFLVGASVLASSLLLIPKLGEYGAAFSKLIAGLVYLLIILIQYVKFRNTIK